MPIKARAEILKLFSALTQSRRTFLQHVEPKTRARPDYTPVK